MSHFIIGNIMELIKKPKDKRPSKKGLINEIESLDLNKDFNLLSLTRTNIDNLVVIRNLLRGVK